MLSHYERNREYYKEKQKKYYQENKKNVLEKKKAYYLRNREQALYHAAKSRSKRFNVPFDLEISDIFIPTHCPILGVELEKETATGCSTSPSLDRIVPSKGYVKGNIRVISFRANRLKSDATKSEMIALHKYFIEENNI